MKFCAYGDMEWWQQEARCHILQLPPCGFEDSVTYMMSHIFYHFTYSGADTFSAGMPGVLDFSYDLYHRHTQMGVETRIFREYVDELLK